MFEINGVTFLNEGYQKDMYQAKKAKEEADRNFKEEERYKRRYVDNHPGRRADLSGKDVDRSLKHVSSGKLDKDIERSEKAIGKAHDLMMGNRGGSWHYTDKEKNIIFDTVNKRMRKNESSIFESVSFLND